MSKGNRNRNKNKNKNGNAQPLRGRGVFGSIGAMLYKICAATFRGIVYVFHKMYLVTYRGIIAMLCCMAIPVLLMYNGILFASRDNTSFYGKALALPADMPSNPIWATASSPLERPTIFMPDERSNATLSFFEQQPIGATILPVVEQQPIDMGTSSNPLLQNPFLATPPVTTSPVLPKFGPENEYQLSASIFDMLYQNAGVLVFIAAALCLSLLLIKHLPKHHNDTTFPKNQFRSFVLGAFALSVFTFALPISSTMVSVGIATGMFMACNATIYKYAQKRELDVLNNRLREGSIQTKNNIPTEGSRQTEDVQI